jgi:hypothetical protein
MKTGNVYDFMIKHYFTTRSIAFDNNIIRQDWFLLELLFGTIKI